MMKSSVDEVVMIRKLTIISTIIAVATVLVYMIFFKENHIEVFSNYKLNDISEYKLLNDERDMLGMLMLEDGSTVSVQTLVDGSYDVLFTANDEAIGIYKAMISEKLLGVFYFPDNHVIYGFGKDKPVNIIFGAPAIDTEDPYDSPSYIGYYDGTCEYPAEFDYVKSKKKCSQYLQDTLDFVGYNTVDEMLEDVFGEDLSKEDNAKN